MWWIAMFSLSLDHKYAALCSTVGVEEDVSHSREELLSRDREGVSLWGDLVRCSLELLWSLWNAAADNHEMGLSVSNYSWLCAYMRKLNSLSWQVMSAPCCKWEAAYFLFMWYGMIYNISYMSDLACCISMWLVPWASKRCFSGISVMNKKKKIQKCSYH